MAISEAKLTALILQSFPDAILSLDDMLGDQDHYGLTIQSKDFNGLSRIQCHQKIYAALGSIMGGELHALSIRATGIPETT